MNNTTITTTTAVTVFAVFTFRPVQFGVLLFASLCSIPCFIFIFYYSIANRAFYRTLSNHSIILIVLISAMQTVLDVPLRLSYYYTGRIQPFTVSFCYFYYFIDVYLFTVGYLLLTWASFERHILIFHSQFFTESRKRLYGHYIPLGFCVIYPLIYYIIFVFFYPCENYFNVTTSYCVTLCYTWASAFMALYEQIIHGFALVFFVCVFNLALFLRVLHQKRRMKQQMTWAKNRNMAIQLFSVCLLFLITNGPYFIMQLVRMLWDPTFGQHVRAWVYPAAFLMPPLMPFIYLYTMQDFKAKITQLIRWPNHRAIMPLSTGPKPNTTGNS